jgi:hypothetical protein
MLPFDANAVTEAIPLTSEAISEATVLALLDEVTGGYA